MDEPETRGERLPQLNIRRLNQPDEQIIRKYVYWSVAGGLIPLPLLDLTAVTAVQLEMLRALCDNHQQRYSENDAKTLITALVGSSLARLGASAIKLLPGIGSFIGGMSMPVLSGASTYAVGRVFSNHFQSGGSLQDFRLENFRTFYTQQFEDGKTVAEEFKEEPKD